MRYTSAAFALMCLIAVATPRVSLAAEPLGVEQVIPDVSVRNDAGDSLRLRDLVAKEPTVIIFYRGGWCPYCNRHLKDLATIEPDLVAAGIQLLAISADQASKLRETPNREQLGYTLLSDSTMKAAAAFGITFEVPAETVAKYKNEYGIDLEAAAGETHHLLPQPSVFVVDRTGTIRLAHVNPDYKVRLDAKKILEVARETTSAAAQ